MYYAVRFERDAARDLVALPSDRRRQIENKIAQYAAHPESLANNVTAMRGVTQLRLRVGGYRVVFRLERNTMIVLKIGSRGNVYR